MISGWLLAFTLSLDDLVIASFTSGPSRHDLADENMVLGPTWRQPEINALSTIMIGIVTIGVITASLVSKSTVARQQREERAAERLSAG